MKKLLYLPFQSVFLILTATTNNTVMMERANLLVFPLLATTAILARRKTMLLCVSKVGYKTENVKLGFKSLYIVK